MDYGRLARQTMPALLEERARQSPERVAYRAKELGVCLWEESADERARGTGVVRRPRPGWGTAAAALAIADRGYVIENGRIVFEGSAARLAASDDVREFYLGTAGGERRKSYRDVKQYQRRRRWFG
jgi:hypothetical protein